MSSFRDDAPPWSFFIPVTLAVIVGVLAADAIRHAIGTVFGGGDAPGQVEAPPREAVTPQRPATPRAAAESAPSADADAAVDVEAAPVPSPANQADAATAAPVPVPRADGVLQLPDAMTARRDGAPAACVNGSVANRVEGGWEQALENDAPVPCVIANP